MDGEQFDRVTRRLATGASRRDLLKAAVAAAAVALGLRSNEAVAAPRCDGDGDCLSLSGSVCVKRRCACPDGQRACNGACVDVKGSDAANCGGCGRSCGPEGVCVDGRCVCDGPGVVKCKGQCIDTSSANTNCGACGNVCTDCFAFTGLANFGDCIDGICQPPAFLLDEFPRLAYCDGKCSDLASDQLNCGACGNRCPRGIGCLDGECDQCPEGQFVCRGAPGCHDFSSDPKHCNGCFKECPAGASCIDSQCQCPDGQRVCRDGTYAFCVDTKTDNNNCGRCRHACNDGFGGEICQDGVCVCADPNLHHCDDVCVDFLTSNNACGGCGKHCPLCSDATGLSNFADCVNGQCAPPAVLLDNFPGLAICDDRCVDTWKDRRNCGACGNRCKAGVDCIRGVCGCDEGERSCGDDCCPEDQLCCAHTCCAPGVVSCDGPGNTCGCAEGDTICGGACCGENRVCCNGTCCPEGTAFCDLISGGCCPPERTCAGICCAQGETCTNGSVCCSAERLCGDVCCPLGATCEGGVCQDVSCDHPAGLLTIRGETCCPSGGGNNYNCGRFKCVFGLSGSGPGGCDVWCDLSEEGALCGPGVDGIPTGENNGRACCCTVPATSTCTWP